MKMSPHHLKRYKDLTVLLLKYAQPGLGRRFAAEQLPASNGQETADAQQLPNDLERLGPTFVKLGQLLSSRL
jgi:ubiquinone biosynthesis protein